jgi:hypothetical protein
MRCSTASLTVVDLFASPELAALSVLESSAEIARLALVAAYPDVPEGDPPLERRAACAVIDAAAELVTEVQRYRLALARARERDREHDDLLPF